MFLHSDRYFVEYSDSISDVSEPNTKVKFNKVVEVLEYSNANSSLDSCPTESSRGWNDQKSPTNGDEQGSPDESEKPKTMLERIKEAKMKNQEQDTVDIQPEIQISEPIEKPVKAKIIIDYDSIDCKLHIPLYLTIHSLTEKWSK